MRASGREVHGRMDRRQTANPVEAQQRLRPKQRKQPRQMRAWPMRRRLQRFLCRRSSQTMSNEGGRMTALKSSRLQLLWTPPWPAHLRTPTRRPALVVDQQRCLVVAEYLLAARPKQDARPMSRLHLSLSTEATHLDDEHQCRGCQVPCQLPFRLAS